jgi:hypothetical protein
MVGAQRTEGLTEKKLLRYADEGKEKLKRIVTGDKSWVHHYQPVSRLCHSSGS